MTLDSLLKCVMGYHGESVQLGEGRNDYIDTIYQLSDTMITRLRSPFLRNPLLWQLSGTRRKWNALCENAHQFTRRIIEDKKREIEKGENGSVNGFNNNADDHNNKGMKKRKCLDFIDMLLRARVSTLFKYELNFM